MKTASEFGKRREVSGTRGEYCRILSLAYDNQVLDLRILSPNVPDDKQFAESDHTEPEIWMLAIGW